VCRDEDYNFCMATLVITPNREPLARSKQFPTAIIPVWKSAISLPWNNEKTDSYTVCYRLLHACYM